MLVRSVSKTSCVTILMGIVIYYNSLHMQMLNYYCCILPLTDHGLQLVGGTSPQSGTLMFQLSNGTWGIVCSHGFNYHTARVACKQLGFNSVRDYGTW